MFRRVAPVVRNARAALSAARPAAAVALRPLVKKSGSFVPLAAAVGVCAVAFAPSVVMADAKVNYDEVRAAIADILDVEDYDDGSMGPVFVRLAWHASGTYCQFDKAGGSNGATMRFDPEASHGANAGLHLARAALEPIKKKFPSMSYADLWTLAGVVAIEEMGGPKIKWRPGRTDASSGKACPRDGLLPDAARGSDHLRAIFHRMGFSDREIVALAGAHSVGRCHTDRSGFDGPWTFSPVTFSNQYFALLLSERWQPRQWNGPAQYQDAGSRSLMMLPADMALTRDEHFRKYVQLYADDENLFFKDFAAAFGKLIELGVPAFDTTDKRSGLCPIC